MFSPSTVTPQALSPAGPLMQQEGSCFNASPTLTPFAKTTLPTSCKAPEHGFSLNHKTIFITGGTGSFGKKFLRMLLARYTPTRVIVYSRDELKQFEMSQHDFPVHQQPCPIHYIIGDVRDGQRLLQAMAGAEVVIHAAALKQVPVAEYHPFEAVKTNILGAQHVIEAALHHQVERVIALSTDKAANPINLYGATKLVSDSLFVAANQGLLPLYQDKAIQKTQFAVVRYGNVIGSRGSVLPYFQELLQQGATSLPITDERMTRFWLPLSHGVDFVFHTLMRMQGGEIFIPKIPSIHMTDLVKALMPTPNYHVVGLRPGEKLHECLCPSELASRTLEFEDHFVIQPAIPELQKLHKGYSVNALGELGKQVPDGFEYISGNNPDFLTPPDIQRLHQEAL
ncbi:MAG: UDP-N-acetylglucosamine 4,6-dehydratase (inverting) [Vampirovibrionales bacterium]